MSKYELNRRSFLGLTAAGAGTVALGVAAPESAFAKPGHAGVGYGPLVPDPKGLLDLPRGFHYKVVAVAGNSGNPVPATRLTDGGEESPSRYDGSASFETRKGFALITNHENGDGVTYPVAMPVPHRKGLTYDNGAAWGGTTTITTDKRGSRLGEVVSLAGTYSNCAGGPTPWGTWLSCEETELKAGTYSTPNGDYTLEKDHGYVFEVHPTDMSANMDPKPIKALGRFAHEGIVVDPKSHWVYMTEDTKKPYGLLYAWDPQGTDISRGFRNVADTAGELYAMKATTASGEHVPDLKVFSKLGTTLKVTWVKVPDRDARKVSVRSQFTDDQVTRSSKYEGAWWGKGGFYFDCSFDKTAHDGQIWFFDVKAQTITLKSYYPLTADQNVDPDGPDNLTVNPYGGVLFCEDGDGQNHLVLDNLKGEWAYLALNRQDSEMAGANFAPGNKVLFANSQDPGVVFAITGPWKSQRG